MKPIGLCLDVAAKVLCASLLAGACSPEGEEAIANEDPSRSSAPLIVARCDGQPASADPGQNNVKVYQEYPPASTIGWCLFADPTPDGLGKKLPSPINNNISTVVVGSNARIDLFDFPSWSGEHVALVGSPAGPNVVDLHALIVEGQSPRGWWADRVSSLKTCLKSAAVNGRCP